MPKAIAQLAPQRPDAKRALLAAAAQLIAEVGWGRVSSRMVAERAGLNNALVHYHFDSMEDLLRQAAEAVMEQAFAAPTRTVWRNRDVTEGMRSAIRWLGRLDVDTVETGVLVETLVQARRDPLLRARGAEGLEALRDDLTRAIEERGGALKAAGARGTATLLLALLDGILLHRVVDPDLDLGPAARSLSSLLGVDAKDVERR